MRSKDEALADQLRQAEMNALTEALHMNARASRDLQMALQRNTALIPHEHVWIPAAGNWTEERCRLCGTSRLRVKHEEPERPTRPLDPPTVLVRSAHQNSKDGIIVTAGPSFHPVFIPADEVYATTCKMNQVNEKIQQRPPRPPRATHYEVSVINELNRKGYTVYDPEGRQI